MPNLYDQYSFNVAPGPFHECSGALPDMPPPPGPVRFIAYYLPQFHAIAENNAWWGMGFTEWSNVTKALPRYLGHRQPRLPADLGFYDLSRVDTLRTQALLARRAGITGFCIHYYWFSGRRVLETPLELLLANPDIDLPFCLNWANESWSRRWDGSEHDVLLEQRYDPGDDLRFAESILPALRDPRYIRVEGRPLLMIYRPCQIPNAAAWAARWRAWFIEQGVGDPFIVMAQVFNETDPRPYGFDAAAGFPPHNGGFGLPNQTPLQTLLDRRFAGSSHSFADLAERMVDNRPTEFTQFPGVCPSWDNEARKPGRGVSFYGAEPALYGAWLESAARQAASANDPETRIVFINAWNEWAEGAILEPDRHHGYAFLAETRRVVDRLAGRKASASPMVQRAAHSALLTPQPSRMQAWRNRLTRIQDRAARRLTRRTPLGRSLKADGSG